MTGAPVSDRQTRRLRSLLRAGPIRGRARVLGLAASLAAACTLAASQQVFRAVGDTVRIFVTVTDRDGRLVTTLTRDAFEVRDEGDPQPITIFDNQPQPIRLVVLLDVSGSMQGNLPVLREAARQLMARLNPGDRVRLGTFGRDIALSPEFTRDAAALMAWLPDTIEPDATTPLWRAIDGAMDAFDGQESGEETRRVVLVLSDGRDSGSFSFGGRPVSQVQAIDAARDRDVMVYAVGMRSRGPRAPVIGVGRGALQSSLAADMPDPGLARVAQETGGGYIELRAGEDLAGVFAGVAEELHRQYLIGYALPARDGKVHDVEVRVRQRGLTPRARKEYRAPS